MTHIPTSEDFVKLLDKAFFEYYCWHTTFPACHICWRNDVNSYPADYPELAICPECCKSTENGHEFEYDVSMRGHICKHCGIISLNGYYDD